MTLRTRRKEEEGGGKREEGGKREGGRREGGRKEGTLKQIWSSSLRLSPLGATMGSTAGRLDTKSKARDAYKMRVRQRYMTSPCGSHVRPMQRDRAHHPC